MDQRESIGEARASEAKATRPLCSLCGEQPVAGGPDALLGEPLCKGPVCRWCYETKVEPARRREGEAPESWGAHGAWAFRTPEGKLVIGALPGGRDAQDALRAACDELVMGMMDEGYFGTVRAPGADASTDAATGIDEVEKLIATLSALAEPGKPMGIGAFGRLYVIPWYGPALLTGPRHVVQTLERKEVMA